MKTREQSLFDELYRRSLKLGYDTYDFKPVEKTKYPFVEFEDTQTIYVDNKHAVLGAAVITLSVWGLQTKRKEVSEMTSKLFAEALQINKTGADKWYGDDGYLDEVMYNWKLDIGGSFNQIIDDTSTNTPLKRGLLELNFTYLGGR